MTYSDILASTYILKVGCTGLILGISTHTGQSALSNLINTCWLKIVSEIQQSLQFPYKHNIFIWSVNSYIFKGQTQYLFMWRSYLNLVGEHQNSGTSVHGNHEKIEQFKMSNSQMLFAVRTKQTKTPTLNDVALVTRKEKWNTYYTPIPRHRTTRCSTDFPGLQKCATNAVSWKPCTWKFSQEHLGLCIGIRSIFILYSPLVKPEIG